MTPHHNPEHILIASSRLNFRECVEIIKEFAKPFPLKRFIHAFNKSRVKFI